VATTYRAVQVSRPGAAWKMAENGTVLMVYPSGAGPESALSLGVANSDSATVGRELFPVFTYPRVPGHGRRVGRIDALGDGVQGWGVGQRVGFGFLGGFLRVLRSVATGATL